MTFHVRITSQAKSVTQSGRGRAGRVILESADLGARTPEPLMGWTASPDTLNQIRLTFDTVEDAVRHATRQGWEYTVVPQTTRRVRPRNYTDNFRYIPPEETARV